MSVLTLPAIGSRVEYTGSRFRVWQAKAWLNAGDVGEVVEVHEAVPGTGRMIGVDDWTGKTIRDEGTPAYVVVRFREFQTAISVADFEKGRYREVVNAIH